MTRKSHAQGPNHGRDAWSCRPGLASQYGMVTLRWFIGSVQIVHFSPQRIRVCLYMLCLQCNGPSDSDFVFWYVSLSAYTSHSTIVTIQFGTRRTASSLSWIASFSRGPTRTPNATVATSGTKTNERGRYQVLLQELTVEKCGNPRSRVFVSLCLCEAGWDRCFCRPHWVFANWGGSSLDRDTIKTWLSHQRILMPPLWSLC